ncbi:MAG: Rieske (2Fe-2S) protein [Bacteroidota bacterium]|nr:Rieske (2Fe-2S) protein [Bacteroidota bacterium]
MGKQKPISRNSFLRIVTGLILGLVAWIWYNLTNFQTERENSLEFRHNQDVPMGISYFEKYYLYRTDRSVRAFLTQCTHAGCRIGMSTGAVLQCNCHGSQFDAETGKPLKGPAIKPLQEIECRFDKENGQWMVSLRPMGGKLS